jgi:glycyl-tRNA synthetase alpha chain
LFNLLNARGVISVAERQAYIGRVRDLVKAVADCWVDQQLSSPLGEGLGAGNVGIGAAFPTPDDSPKGEGRA